MTGDSHAGKADSKRARWIAAGFLGAFATSVLTVIYTGLMVEGSPSEFEAGFRAITMGTAETRTVELVFDSAVESPDAVLEISLPVSVGIADATAEAAADSTADASAERPADSPGSAELIRAVAVTYGRNAYPIELVGRAPGSGYLTARLVAGQPVGIERVFVTVTATAAEP